MLILTLMVVPDHLLSFQKNSGNSLLDFGKWNVVTFLCAEGFLLINSHGSSLSFFYIIMLVQPVRNEPNVPSAGSLSSMFCCFHPDVFGTNSNLAKISLT